MSEVSGAFLTALENAGERFICTPSRTHNRRVTAPIHLHDGQGRKVRSPEGSMPANGRGDSLKAGFTESATENVPPVPAREPVRVKRCGKSAPRLR